ncbi:hypothetical protein [uncultured Jatrophihabitans sp.]|uniref:hypothetical protein n=1 Tax=uncultured Jatrophihabitans sp. TaxID=1610747 RepID=UPI0035CAF5A9
MMTPGFSSRRFIGGTEIKPGATFNHDPSYQLRFSIQVVCAAVDPDQWKGRLVLANRTVFETDPLPTFEQAAAAAKDRLIDQVAYLVAGEA